MNHLANSDLRKWVLKFGFAFKCIDLFFIYVLMIEKMHYLKNTNNAKYFNSIIRNYKNKTDIFKK